MKFLFPKGLRGTTHELVNPWIRIADMTYAHGVAPLLRKPLGFWGLT